MSGAHLNPAVTLAQALRRGFPWRKVPSFWFAQVTAFLVGFILACIDEYNAPVKANLAPLVIGFIVVASGLSYGANAGYAINPARDFGPRLWAWIAGWKAIAMPGNDGNVNTYLWIPIVGPLAGGALGALIYDFGIRNVLIARGVAPDPEVADKDVEALDEPGGAA